MKRLESALKFTDPFKKGVLDELRSLLSDIILVILVELCPLVRG